MTGLTFDVSIDFRSLASLKGINLYQNYKSRNVGQFMVRNHPKFSYEHCTISKHELSYLLGLISELSVDFLCLTSFKGINLYQNYKSRHAV
jgi:hypothetical protein